MPIATVNPATGETLRTFDALGPEEIERRLALAVTAFGQHRTTEFGRAGRTARTAPRTCWRRTSTTSPAP